jgi:hypothetical protein
LERIITVWIEPDRPLVGDIERPWSGCRSLQDASRYPDILQFKDDDRPRRESHQVDLGHANLEVDEERVRIGRLTEAGHHLAQQACESAALVFGLKLAAGPDL